MKNLLAISLVPAAKKQLKTIIKAAIPNFGRVRVTSEEVILQKRLFSRKHRIELMPFLTETLPKEMNKWAQSKDIESPLPYFGNSVEFLLHLDAIGQKNLISYLWKCYTQVITFNKLGSTPVQQITSHYVMSTRIITNVMARKVVRDFNRMRNTLKLTIRTDGLRFTRLDVVHISPDIRGSPDIIPVYLNGAERLIS